MMQIPETGLRLEAEGRIDDDAVEGDRNDADTGDGIETRGRRAD